MARSNKASGKAESFILDIVAAQALGKTIAGEAAEHQKQAGNAWATSSTGYIMAQDNGKAGDWLAAFIKGGESVKGAKSPWYRTVKSILTRSLKLSADKAQMVTEDGKLVPFNLPLGIGMRAAQNLVKETEQAGADPAEIQAAALKFVAGIVKSAAEKGCTKAQILEAVTDALAEYEGDNE